MKPILSTLLSKFCKLKKKRKQKTQPKKKGRYITHWETKERVMADLASETMRSEGSWAT